MIFHYDGIVDEWNDLEWSSQAIHVSAMNQTKWYVSLLTSNLICIYHVSQIYGYSFFNELWFVLLI